MTPEKWQRIEQLYHEALQLARAERARFLKTSCEGDDQLLREVESLLDSHDFAPSFIESPPDDVAASLLADSRVQAMRGRTIGRYTIDTLIGAGGMGEVYRGKDTTLDRPVAIKVLAPHLVDDARALHRFKREVKAVAAISHPNIVAIYDFGVDSGIAYAVSELLEGETLRTRIKRGECEWREAVKIAIAISDGLSAAHVKRIIHRDLKPENIFLTKDRQIKILDFGIARIKPASSEDMRQSALLYMTVPGTVLGTFGYAAPEQLLGETVDIPADIFSLGCVLFEMISGQRPSPETRRTLAGDEARLPEILDRAPGDLEPVIRKCLKPGAEDRYQSAGELARVLKVILRMARA